MLLYLALCTGANGKKVPWTPVLKQRSRDSQLAEFCWPCLKRVWWVPEDLFGWKVNVPQGSIPEGTSLQAEGSAKYGRTAAITFHMSQLHVGGTQRQVTMGNMLVLITKLWKCVLHPLFFYFLADLCLLSFWMLYSPLWTIINSFRMTYSEFFYLLDCHQTINLQKPTFSSHDASLLPLSALLIHPLK